MKCDKSQRWLQCTDKKTTFKQGEQGDTPKTWLYDTTICSVSVQDPKNMTQKGIRCKKGYTGPMCMACDVGHVPYSSTCIECPKGASVGLAFAVTFAVIALPLIIFTTSIILCDVPKHIDKGSEHLKNSSKIFGLFKIMLCYVQILISLSSSMPHVPWPNSFLTMTSIFRFVNLDILSFFQMSSCEFGLSFNENFIIHMTIPFVISISILSAYLMTLLLKKTQSKHEQMHRFASAAKIGIFSITLVYPGVTTKVFKVLLCSPIPGLENNGNEWLDADWRTKCWIGEHNTFVVISIISCFLFVLGIPALMWICLYRNYHHLYDNTSEYHEEKVLTFGSLYSQYEPKYWYFECIIMLQKALMTGGLCLIGRGTNFQPLAAAVMQCIYMCIVLKFEPYVNYYDDLASFVSSLTLAFVSLIASAMYIDRNNINRDHHGSFNTLDILLIIVSVGGLLFQLILVIKTLMSADGKRYKRTRTLLTKSKVRTCSTK